MELIFIPRTREHFSVRAGLRPSKGCKSCVTTRSTEIPWVFDYSKTRSGHAALYFGMYTWPVSFQRSGYAFWMLHDLSYSCFPRAVLSTSRLFSVLDGAVSQSSPRLRAWHTSYSHWNPRLKHRQYVRKGQEPIWDLCWWFSKNYKRSITPNVQERLQKLTGLYSTTSLNVSPVVRKLEARSEIYNHPYIRRTKTFPSHAKSLFHLDVTTEDIHHSPCTTHSLFATARKISLDSDNNAQSLLI